MPTIPPLEVIASWPPANTTDPVTRGNTLIVISTVTTSIAAVAVLLRLGYRHSVKQLWWDDLLASLALVSILLSLTCIICLTCLQFCSIGLTIVSCYANDHAGWSNHLYDLVTEWATIERALKTIYAAKLFYGICVLFSRWSILAFYSRLLGGTGVNKSWLLALRVTTWIVVTFGIAFALVSVFNCQCVLCSSLADSH